jgi:uncharacterized membrane protein
MSRIFWAFIVMMAGCSATGKINCADQPLITYNNFGQSFIEKECQGCHGSFIAGNQRQGAPLEFTYDTPEEVWEDAELILVTSTGKDAIMPPADGVFPEDRLRLEIWLRCGQNGAIDGIQLEQEAP